MITVHVHWPEAPHGRNVDVRQPRPEQHDVPPAEQLWPAPTHEDAWQVPLIAPAGITQVLPLQQSDVVVHVAPCAWQTTGVPQVPLEQICEQQFAENWQAWPFAVQRTVPPSPTTEPPSGSTTVPPSDSTTPPSGNTTVPPSPPLSISGRHAPARHSEPLQQFADEVQAAPSGVQVGDSQRSTPPSPGRHSALLQHWSLNWHTSPAAMQHGASPV
jgi:hypothetical protein